MTAVQSLLAFALAAGLLTLTPGLDTALVLRAAAEGQKRAVLAALGVCSGCLAWGAAAALGLSALLQVSSLAFTMLKWAGAGYLVWLGLGLLLRPRKAWQADRQAAPERNALAWLRKGLLTNLLNPKVGVFYLSFLPQFVPQGVAPAPFIFLLAALHALIGLAWFTVLIAATRPVAAALKRPAVARWLDRITGGVFLGFGVRLALEHR